MSTGPSLVRCENRKMVIPEGQGEYIALKDWDHADCEDCNGAKYVIKP